VPRLASARTTLCSSFALQKSEHFSDLNTNHRISLPQHPGDIPVFFYHESSQSNLRSATGTWIRNNQKEKRYETQER
jgi:hypothetical protein